MRSSECPGNSPAELIVRYRFWGTGIDRTTYTIRIQTEQDEPNHIFEMNPGQPLLSAADSPAGEQLIRKGDEGESTA
ncbi:hypothetical protein D3C84_1233980 [compost metagenome]